MFRGRFSKRNNTISSRVGDQVTYLLDTVDKIVYGRFVDPNDQASLSVEKSRGIQFDLSNPYVVLSEDVAKTIPKEHQLTINSILYKILYKHSNGHGDVALELSVASSENKVLNDEDWY